MSLTMRSRFVLLVTGAIAASLTVAISPASRAADDGPAMQMLADATLIDAECRTTNVMFGIVFRHGEEHGIRRVDILPLGKRRSEFETAMNWRVKTAAPGEICGVLQETYRDTFPSWFGAR